MKKWTWGQILTVALPVVLFLIRIALKADSAEDWVIGLGLLAAALLVAWWLTRFDRPAPGSAPAKIESAPRPAPNVLRNEPPVESAPVPVCSACGARSTGTKFCPECGKLFQPGNACSHCGAPFQRATKFCPECGAKAG